MLSPTENKSFWLHHKVLLKINPFGFIIKYFVVWTGARMRKVMRIMLKINGPDNNNDLFFKVSNEIVQS